jgi:hypothetical protein
MDDISPFFEIDEEATITSLKELLDLSKKSSFGSLTDALNLHLASTLINPDLVGYHETSGIFRGQAQDWPLIPVAYRNITYDLETNVTDMQMRLQYHISNHMFETFCTMASKQNKRFPKSPIERMCIAQHYGIATPLLDWTTNILVAVYFALDLKDEKILDKNLEPFIYHLKDERWLKSGIQNETDLFKVNYSALVNAPPLDRRIERQFSVFSYHPTPLNKPQKIPLSKYKISGDLFFELWKIMEGIGFSSSHLFPDYAGLVDRIKKGYMI